MNFGNMNSSSFQGMNPFYKQMQNKKNMKGSIPTNIGYINKNTIRMNTEIDDMNYQLMTSCFFKDNDYDKENFEKIFNKFSRIDNPLTRSTEGSGIGLYITKSIIEKMNGTILPLEQEQGTSFVLTFDICDFQTQSQNKIQGEKSC